jgi:hypothetical protein
MARSDENSAMPLASQTVQRQWAELKMSSVLNVKVHFGSFHAKFGVRLLSHEAEVRPRVGTAWGVCLRSPWTFAQQYNSTRFFIDYDHEPSIHPLAHLRQHIFAIHEISYPLLYTALQCRRLMLVSHVRPSMPAQS